ncbi:MAG: hypothetical protein R3F13_11625 [Prosthecobacter sp.]
MNRLALLLILMLASCGKEEVKEQPKAAEAPKKVTNIEKKKEAPPPVPQGKLPQMDPEKAKFIAAPNTPKDAEVRKADASAKDSKK